MPSTTFLFSRRSFASLVWVSGLLWFCPTGPAAAQEVRLNLEPKAGEVVHCRTQVEFGGQVVLFPSTADAESKTPPAPTRLPLEVKALHEFDQIVVDTENTLRKYSTAKAAIKVDGQPTENVLSETNRQIAVRSVRKPYGRPLQFISAGGSLKQSEQDLLIVPGDLCGLMRILNREAINVNEKWEPSNEAVQAFFSCDQILENKIQLLVKEVDSQQIAKVYLMGECLGEVDGAKTRLRLTGVALVDLQRNLPKAFRATLQEVRAPSQLAPGFEGTIKIDLTCNPKAQKELSSEVVKQVSAKISERKTTRLLWNSESAFEIVYEPNWKIILADPDVVIMRYAEKGNLLAQCNILSLPRRPENKPLALNEFQRQLEKTVLGDGAARIVTAQNLQTAAGMSVLKVQVAGEQDEVPIHWIYYHLSNSEGRCCAVVVTIEEAALTSFAQADLRLMDEIRFIEQNRQATNLSDSPPVR